MILLLFPLKLNLLEAHANYFGLLKDEVAEFSSFRLVKLILVHWNGIEGVACYPPLTTTLVFC